MNDMEQRNLSTADLAAAAQPARAAANDAERVRAERREDVRDESRREDAARRGDGRDQLAPLFPGDLAQQFRSRWDQVQSGFVDDPREAVRHGDELVAQVMKSLAESFAAERQKL